MFHIIIPARYQSSRLPGKPLLDIGGIPMIVHVYRQALKAGAGSVVIATDDERIENVLLAEGAQVFMSDIPHDSGTERLGEVVEKLDYSDDDIIVNLQGDEPFVPIQLLQQVGNDLQQHTAASMSTIYIPLDNHEDVFNPNVVKVVLDKENYALYFSRAPIPWLRDDFADDKKDDFDLSLFHRHIGIYAYRASFIKQYARLPISPLEKYECLEQLRVLWNGHKIILSEAIAVPGQEVNTVQDLEKARQIYEKINIKK
jgi:3-deoxy-manno-octulosonate cytidylyltransferase (CMP-KDO synthetase)